jgi:hypothetical protein
MGGVLVRLLLVMANVPVWVNDASLKDTGFD